VKKSLYHILITGVTLLAGILLFTGCESGGDDGFTYYNNSSYDVTVRTESGKRFTIPAGGTHSGDGPESFAFSPVGAVVPEGGDGSHTTFVNAGGAAYEVPL
jgi:hypothetical protein